MNNPTVIAISIFLSIGNVQCQSLEEKVKVLEQENEQLKRELAKCQNAPLTKLLDNIENQKHFEEPKYSREEFHEIVLPKIKANSVEKYEVAIEIIKQTEEFIIFCESIKNEMIERTGGLDTLRNRPKGCSDKTIGNIVLLEEGKGKLLQEKINQIKDKFLGIVADNQYYIERISLNDIAMSFPQEKYSSWEEYKFKNMPLCPLMPLIANIKSKGEESEIAVLQYLNE